MSVQRTLAIIKPDAVSQRNQGKILQRILDEQFEVLALRQVHLSRRQVESFYAEHRGQPFFEDLCSFMSSAPCVVIALGGEDAVAHWRRVLGKTNPDDADANTIRKLFGTKMNRNAAHGSDSAESGSRECAYFFVETDLL